jgi:predicted dehydrogenase
MKKIRYAIIGAGMMGHEHLRNIAMLASDNVSASVSSIVEPDSAMRESAIELARSLGLAASPGDTNFDSQPLTSHTSTADVDWQRVDAIVIVSPNNTHCELLCELLPLDIPILVEKPLCTTTEDLHKVEALMENRSSPVWVAMEYRYMPPTAKFIADITGGRIGRLQMLSIREHRYPFLDKVDDWNRFSEKTGGTMVEKCCHYFDLMRLITGSEPVRIYCSGAADINHRDESYNGRTPDIIDNAYAIVDFSNGTRCALDLCMFAEGSEPQETITAIGDAGKLEARIPGPDRFWPDAPPRHAEVAYMPREPQPPIVEPVVVDEALLAAGDHHGGTFYQHRKFLDAIQNGAPVEVTLRDGARAVAMGIAAEESIRTGQAVSLA